MIRPPALPVLIALTLAAPCAAAPDEAEALRRFGDPEATAPAVLPFRDGKFDVTAGETIVFAGQANFVREEWSGQLEARLASAYADRRPVFRSMAWEGDTVYEQWRDLNFGSWESQLRAVGATMVIAQFGRMEALDGVERIPEFAAACHRLLDRFAAVTPRIVVVSPGPFEPPADDGSFGRGAPDLSLRNADAAAYAKALQDIARQRGLVFVDLTAALAKRGPGPRLTDFGLHWNAAGLAAVADAICGELGVPAAAGDLSGLRAEIVRKNRLWFDCWRPANWNFVYGDRAEQLFATAAGDAPSLRETFERHKPMIAACDARIHALAAGGSAPPPPDRRDPPAAPPDPVRAEDVLASFQPADGYAVNLFAAAEADGVVKPVQLSWDERGRMYVACSPTYPHVLPGVAPADFVLCAEDTDGNGRADRTWRFAEGLTMVQGIEPAAGGLLVCDFDKLVHLRDTDGDGRADRRQVLFSGFGVGDTHQLINSIAHGPDGSLWFTQGLHIMSRVETPHGIARLDHAGVWRLNPRTLRLDAFFNGAKAGHNCWGVAFDDYAQVFHKSGDRPEGYYTVPGMIRIPDPSEYHGVGALFQTSPKTTSLDIVGTAALPDDIQGCAVIGGYFGGVVELHRFVDDGAGFRTEQLPKLLRSSHEAFRPVDVAVGPDGAIYLADWCNPVIGHYQASYADPHRNRTGGFVWRISATDRPPVRPPDLAGMDASQRFAQLRSPERWIRAQAARLLAEAPADEVLPAADAFLESLDPADGRALLCAVNVCQAHGSVTPEQLRKLTGHADPRVRAGGMRIAGLRAEAMPGIAGFLRNGIADPHPRVRLEAVVACSEVRTPDSLRTMLGVLDREHDRFLEYALTQAVRALEPQWPALLAGGDAAFDRPEHATWLREFAGARPAPVHPGQTVYNTLCLNCHQPGGRGLPGVYPALVGSERVAGPVRPLVRMLLHGFTGPGTASGDGESGRAVVLPMPPSGLNDRRIADVLSFVRQEFGKSAGPVTEDEVAAIRRADAGRTVPWTAAELDAPAP